MTKFLLILSIIFITTLCSCRTGKNEKRECYDAYQFAVEAAFFAGAASHGTYLGDAQYDAKQSYIRAESLQSALSQNRCDCEDALDNVINLLKFANAASQQNNLDSLKNFALKAENYALNTKAKIVAFANLKTNK
jgi:hypothetical protein